jgi:hypothetical protein
MSLLDLLGIRDFLPEGPVLDPGRRVHRFGAERPAGVRYTSTPASDLPGLPLQVFGVAYDLDLMLVSDHPSWNMHEYARLLTPDGPVWLAKDAREHTLEQSIVAEIDGLEHWVPEVPVRRRWSKVEVHDRSTLDWLDLDLSYTNLDDEPVRVQWRGPAPTHLERHRNSSTMGHSRDQVLVALDLSHKAAARSASLTIAGQRRRIRRLLGLVPLRYALIQAQAGFSIGSWTQSPTPDGARTVHASGTSQSWDLRSLGADVELTQRSPLRTLSYRFRRAGQALELLQARVEQYGRPVPVCDVRFSPALPDVRLTFEGTWTGSYVIDVNGQASHAIGAVEATCTPDGVRLRLLPEAPRWTTDRPMQVEIIRRGEALGVEVFRV